SGSGGEGGGSGGKGGYADVEAIEAPDPTSITFKLSAVNASFLTLLASPFNCIYSAAKLQQNPRYPDTEIMGSGAYRLVEHVRGSFWSARRFDDYFRKGQPYLGGYKAYFVQSTAVVPGLLGGPFDAEFRGPNSGERDQVLARGGKEKRVVKQRA